MNIPEENVISTFLTVATEEAEPFEPKNLHQAKNDTSWLEWERAMLKEPYYITDGILRVYKLRKVLYRLNFELITADLSIFIRSNIYIAVYVDNLLIVGPSIIEIKKIKRSLRNRFQITDLGLYSYYLRISI
ncbi:Reverse transcriptase, RNA-dependent DNA polymerase [Penicillium camemberti]|uniref:Reverse transcriptase, RNA-dependent DNA polymerase n=1 Tax=Penicillium camemberti (strain FM 013) TaxID=1429867 RepID=A0A0G4PY31_PENC3|nr:Reverse transcriptase, RNA-dependent DNA polymerase [Penicillium camemberti]